MEPYKLRGENPIVGNGATKYDPTWVSLGESQAKSENNRQTSDFKVETY
jgi:hypothetical protein